MNVNINLSKKLIQRLNECKELKVLVGKMDMGAIKYHIDCKQLSF